MKKIIAILGKFIFGIIGIVLISATPALFRGNTFFDFPAYALAVKNVITAFFTPNEWTLSYLNLSTFETVPFSFSSFLSGPYLYSMPLLLMALVLSFVIAFVLALLTLQSNGVIKRSALQFVKILQSFPDFSYVFLIQIVVLAFYSKTDTLLLSFYSLGGERIYLTPILCLSVLPTLLFFKLFILLYEEEQQRSYVELARSKGLSQFEVLWKHCTSNVLRSVFYQSKSIVWLTLSTLLIIEYLFGIEGILYYLRSDFSPKGITFILLTVFIPFFLFYTFMELLMKKSDVERNAVFEKFNLRIFDEQEIRTSWKRILSKKLKTAKPFSFRFKNRMAIIIPLLLVVSFLSASLLYGVVADDEVEQIQYAYDEDGSIASSAPLAPSAEVVFGTDPYGFSIAQQLLVGIKYTIILSLLIATLRVALGYVFGLLYVFFLNNKARNIVNSIADGMHFLPLTLLVYILLLPVLISSGEWNSTLWERLAFQVLIMSAVVLPITASAIGNEMNETLKKDYVVSSVLMGGSLSWILTKHIQPQLWPKLVLMWTQHIVQVLQMFVHLGILNIFVGGALSQIDSPRLIPEIYELSGMISISREVFVTNQYWMILPPLAIFMMLIYCFTTIAEYLTKKQVVPVKVTVTNESKEELNSAPSFTRIKNPQVNEETN